MNHKIRETMKNMNLNLNDMVEGDTPIERYHSKLQLMSARRSGLHALRMQMERESKRTKKVEEDRFSTFLKNIPNRKIKDKRILGDEEYITAIEKVKDYLKRNPSVITVNDVDDTDMRGLIYSIARTDREEVQELELS